MDLYINVNSVNIYLYIFVYICIYTGFYIGKCMQIQTLYQ